MDYQEHSAGPPAIRLSAEQIMQAAPGDVIWHPGGFLVELVRCYPGTGYWFWHRVDERTLTRHGTLEGGPWLAAADAALPSGDWPRREIELLSANQKRRETLIAQLQQLHAEMVVLGEISNVLYGNIIRTGKRMPS
jgi:hypothetical protein